VTTDGACPDLVYRLPTGNVAVFLDDTAHDQESDDNGGATHENGAGRDERARDDLRDLGWAVITIATDAQWPVIAARYPSVFGSR
jgi:hypothetical protein